MKKVKLGEVTINIDNRRKPLNNLQRIEKSLTKKYPYCGANNIIDFIDEYIFDENEEILCIAEDGGSWGKDEECTYVMNEKCWVNNHAHVLKMKTGVDINYIKLNLDYLDLTSYITGSTRGKLTKSSLEKIELKLPDYHTQISISKRISDIQKLITKKKDQIQKYKELVKSRFNELFGDVILNDKEWKISKWNEILTIRNGKNQKNVEDKNGQFPIYGSGGIIGYAKDWIVKKNSVIIGRKGNINKPILVRENFWNVDTAFGLEPTLEKINSEYLFYFCQLYNFEKLNKAVTIPSLTKSDLLDISLPLPPLSLQNEFADFVAQVDKSQLAIQKSLEELETLKKSLMQEYFG
ncbi:restriction endonuclease subunit S [Streptococcus infantis]|uniref:restriction endonuclease subunit S n=1 Tax=Streptococcus infantis TaxID=68892 RepID=UPI0039C36DB9